MSEPPRDRVGEVIEGRYRITSRLGGGAAGSVYRADDLGGGPPVAIKVWNSSVVDSQAAGRFHRETKALRTLEHPNIVAIRDYGLTEGVPYLAMELLEGTPLENLLVERGALPPEVAITIVTQVLKALAYAHDRQVVHRDLKPDNVCLLPTRDGSIHVKLLDYGLAKFLAPQDDPVVGTLLTKRGTLVGTPLYMAPEQALGKAIDTRTDVYAVGCVLFEMLTGQPPFMAPNLTELLRAHLSQPVPRLSQVKPGLPASEALQTLLDRALAKQASARFADADAMLRAVTALPIRLPEAEPVTLQMTRRSQAPEAEPEAEPASASGRSRGSSHVVLWMMAATVCAAVWWFLR